MLDNSKNYIAAALLALLGIIKLVTDIEVVESITVLGISEPVTLISTGIAWALARNALPKKLSNE